MNRLVLEHYDFVLVVVKIFLKKPLNKRKCLELLFPVLCPKFYNLLISYLACGENNLQVVYSHCKSKVNIAIGIGKHHCD